MVIGPLQRHDNRDCPVCPGCCSLCIPGSPGPWGMSNCGPLGLGPTVVECKLCQGTGRNPSIFRGHYGHPEACDGCHGAGVPIRIGVYGNDGKFRREIAINQRGRLAEPLQLAEDESETALIVYQRLDGSQFSSVVPR